MSYSQFYSLYCSMWKSLERLKQDKQLVSLNQSLSLTPIHHQDFRCMILMLNHQEQSILTHSRHKKQGIFLVKIISLAGSDPILIMHLTLILQYWEVFQLSLSFDVKHFFLLEHIKYFQGCNLSDKIMEILVQANSPKCLSKYRISKHDLKFPYL